jgi:hypothetical protein
MVNDVNMSHIRNRNEKRVAACMREELATMMDAHFSDQDLQDVFAYALNQLPARYTKPGTIVLGDMVRKSEVMAVVREAFELIARNPKN